MQSRSQLLGVCSSAEKPAVRERQAPVERGKGRKQFCAFSARARFHTGWPHSCRGRVRRHVRSRRKLTPHSKAHPLVNRLNLALARSARRPDLRARRIELPHSQTYRHGHDPLHLVTARLWLAPDDESDRADKECHSGLPGQSLHARYIATSTHPSSVVGKRGALGRAPTTHLRLNLTYAKC